MQSAYFNQSKRFFPQVFPEGYFQTLAGQKPNRYLEIGKSMVHHTRETNRMHQIAFFTLSFVSSVSSFPTKEGQGEFRAEGSKFGRNKPAQEADHHTREVISRGWIFETLLHLLLCLFSLFFLRFFFFF